MKLTTQVILSLIYIWDTNGINAQLKWKNLRRFPEEFVFGASTSAYQIEGAWNEDGKAESVWDQVTHRRPDMIVGGHTADVAADSYHNYKRDVEMLRELGLDYYRFSISWPRILPNGFANEVNELGIAYYNNLINELLKYNIQPIITLYHWDLPTKLQELGGWTNPLIVEWFSDYARVAFEKFGDRVKNFNTANEPREICEQVYVYEFIEDIENDGLGQYLCAKNVLLAHAKTWHIYDKEFRPQQGGLVGISQSLSWFLPASGSEDDIQAAEDLRQFEWQFCHPIFSDTGDWHPIFRSRVATRSAEQGFPRSRLPQFTQDEIADVKGASDFLGLNIYTSYKVFSNASVLAINPEISFYSDAYKATFVDPVWPPGNSIALKETPWGLHLLLKQLKVEFNNPPVYITENGYASLSGIIDDDRVHYYRSYLNAVLDALDDGCDVRGYMAWSLMDNFEWNLGYTKKFGLYEVDFEDAARTRTPRKSAFIYKEIVRSRVIDPSFNPASLNMTIDEGH